MSFGLNVTYVMKPGKGGEFLQRIQDSGVADAIRREEGCLQYDYFLPWPAGDKVLLVERWASRQAQQVHMGQPHMALLGQIKDACVLQVQLEQYDL